MIFGFSSWFLFIYPFKQLQDIIENRMLFWIHYTKCPVILQLLGSISMKQIQQSTDCRTASEGFRRSQARVEWTAIEEFVSTLRSSLEFLQTCVMDVIKLSNLLISTISIRQNILFSHNHLIWYYISYPFASKDMITVEISAFQQRPKWSVHWVSRSSFFPWAPWSSRSIDFPVDLLPFMDKTAFISGFRAFCAVSWIPL